MQMLRDIIINVQMSLGEGVFIKNANASEVYLSLHNESIKHIRSVRLFAIAVKFIVVIKRVCALNF